MKRNFDKNKPIENNCLALHRLFGKQCYVFFRRKIWQLFDSEPSEVKDNNSAGY